MEKDGNDAKADAAKDKADAAKDGSPEVRIPEGAGHKGTITIDANPPIESLVLAYQAVGRFADRIVECVKPICGENSTILIHNPADAAGLGEFQVFQKRTSIFDTRLTDLAEKAKAQTGEAALDQIGKELNIIPPLIAGAIGAIGSLIGPGLQLLSLFRADNEIKNYKIEVEDEVLAITVAGRLTKSSYQVFSTRQVPITPVADSEVVKTLTHLDELRIELAGYLALLGPAGDTGGEEEDTEGDESSEAQPKLAALRGEANRSTSHPAVQAPDLIEMLKKINTGNKEPPDTPSSKLRAEIAEALKEYDSFLSSLSKVDEKSGASKLPQILAGERLSAVLGGGAWILWLKAVAAGGSAHTKTTTWSSNLTYSGGAIASYAIFDNKGQLRAADTLPMYGGCVQIKDLPFVKIGSFGAPPEAEPEDRNGRGWPSG